MQPVKRKFADVRRDYRLQDQFMFRYSHNAYANPRYDFAAFCIFPSTFHWQYLMEIREINVSTICKASLFPIWLISCLNICLECIYTYF